MMFWYSTKEYKPSDSGQYLAYQENTGFCFICDVVHLNNGSFYFNDPYSDEYLTNITHFARIPPIPIVNKTPVDCQLKVEGETIQELQRLLQQLIQ